MHPQAYRRSARATTLPEREFRHDREKGTGQPPVLTLVVEFYQRVGKTDGTAGGERLREQRGVRVNHAQG